MDEPNELGVEIASQGFRYFMFSMVCLVVSGVGAILVARLLGPSNYGLYKLSLTIPLLLSGLTGLGVDSGVIKYVSHYLAKKNYDVIKKIFYSTFTFKFIVSLVVAFITYYLSDLVSSSILNRPELSTYIKVLSVVILIQALYYLVNNFLYGFGYAGLSSLLGLFNSIVKFPLAIFLIILGFGVMGVVTGYIAGILVSTILGLIYIVKLLHKQKYIDSNGIDLNIKNILRMILSYGFVIYLAVFLSLLSSQYINLVLAWFASDAEIGGYNVSNDLCSIISLFLSTIPVILFPSFSMIEAADSTLLPQAFDKAVKCSLLFVTPVAVFTSIFSKSIISIIYGWKYLFASSYLSILAITYIIQPIFFVIISYFNGVGLNKNTLKTYILYFIVLLVLAPTLTLYMHVVGTILSILAAILVSVIYGLRKCSILNLPVNYQYILRFYLAIAIPGIICLTINNLFLTYLPHIFSLLIGLIIYIATLLPVLAILNVPSNDDLEFIWRYFKNIRLISLILNLTIKLIKGIRRTRLVKEVF